MSYHTINLTCYIFWIINFGVFSPNQISHNVFSVNKFTFFFSDVKSFINFTTEYSPITCSWNVTYTLIHTLAKWHKNKNIKKSVSLFTFCEHQLQILAAYVQHHDTRNTWLQGLINQMIIIQHTVHHHHHHHHHHHMHMLYQFTHVQIVPIKTHILY